MAQIHSHSRVAVPAEFAFRQATDFARMPEWLFGLQSVQCVSAIKTGLGARYRTAVKLGVTLRSEMEVTDYEPNRLFATRSCSGIVNQSTWRFTELDDELTDIDLSLTYELPGGLAGRALAKAIEPFMAVGIANSERDLCTFLETLYRCRVSG